MVIPTDNLELLAKDKSIGALKLLLEHFNESYGISAAQLVEMVSGKAGAENIPLSAFSMQNLSALEIIVKYLKENAKKSYHEIAEILNRDDRTIWSTYNNSLKKNSKALNLDSDIYRGAKIPLSLFSDRNSSVLEAIVIFLKDQLGYGFKSISDALKKDYQTIYTTYRRGKVKKNAR